MKSPPFQAQTLDIVSKAIDLTCDMPLFETKRDDHQRKMFDNMVNMWELKTLTDFTIVVEEREFPVYRCVLAAQSSVFAAMFENDEQVKASNKLKIKDCSEDVVEDFLSSLYNGTFDYNELDMFSLACVFDLPEMKSLCKHLVVTKMSKMDTLKALKLGNMYDSEDIVEAAFLEIKKNYSDVKISETLKHKPERVEEIVEKIKRCKEEIESLNNDDD
jgi:BTB/POZ domain